MSTAGARDSALATLVRRADVGDVGSMALVHAAAFAATGEAPWSAETLERMLRTAGGFADVAERAGAIAGFVIARAMAGESEILTIAVARDRQRSGVGTALLGRAMAGAAQRGAATMFLEVAADNGPAAALYAAAGFREVGRRAGYYARDGSRPVDARVMRAELSQAKRSIS